MAVVLVREQENFLASAESGNILLKTLVAWLLDRKAIVVPSNKCSPPDLGFDYLITFKTLERGVTGVVGSTALDMS